MQAITGKLALAALALILSGPAWALPVCERTPQVRDAIVDKAGVYSCESVDAAALSRMRQGLDLENAAIDSLKAGDFDGLTSLQSLALSGNRLTALPVGLFGGMASLAVLGLGGNDLTELPAGIFDGLDSLQILFLSENRLTTLPAGVFDGLTSLEWLVLRGNHLSALPAGIFYGLPSLEYVQLSRNCLALPAGRFAGLGFHAFGLDEQYDDPSACATPAERQMVHETMQPLAVVQDLNRRLPETAWHPDLQMSSADFRGAALRAYTMERLSKEQAMRCNRHLGAYDDGWSEAEEDGWSAAIARDCPKLIIGMLNEDG